MNELKSMSVYDMCNMIKAELKCTCDSFVSIGFFLKQIKENELFRETGHKNIYEFAQEQFGFSKSSASRFMAINDKFSLDGNSQELADEYKGFTSSKLSEMLTLTDQQLGNVKPNTTIKEIRDMKPKKVVEVIEVVEEQVPGQMQIDDYPEVIPEQEVIVATSQQEMLIDELDLSVRTYNCIKRVGIDTVDKLCEYAKENDLTEIKNVSPKSVDEIFQKLKEFGYDINHFVSKACDGNCFYCENDSCNGHQEKRTSCIYDNQIPCNLYNAHDVAIGLGANCVSSCCNRCDEECGARCNYASQSKAIATVEEKVEPIQFELPHKMIVSFVESILVKDWFEKLLSQKNQDDAVALLKSKQGGSVGIADWGNLVTGQRVIISDQITRPDVAHLNWLGLLNIIKDCYEGPYVDGWICNNNLTEEECIEEKNTQPELQVLKNNEQRTNFIDAYLTWPIWIDQTLTGEKYYKYDFGNDMSIVVRVSLAHKYNSSGKYNKEAEYCQEEYFLMGVNQRYTTNGYKMNSDKDKTFKESATNKTALVEFLKKLQRGEIE